MKKLLMLTMVLIAMAFWGCKEEPITPPDILTDQEVELIDQFTSESRIRVWHLQRFMTKPQSIPETAITRSPPIPSCWGRKRAKIEEFMTSRGITDKDIQTYLLRKKPSPLM